jgi:hypothetical protein
MRWVGVGPWDQGFVLEKNSVPTELDDYSEKFGLNSVNFRNVKCKIRFGSHWNRRMSPKFRLIWSNPWTLRPCLMRMYSSQSICVDEDWSGIKLNSISFYSNTYELTWIHVRASELRSSLKIWRGPMHGQQSKDIVASAARSSSSCQFCSRFWSLFFLIRNLGDALTSTPSVPNYKVFQKS